MKTPATIAAVVAGLFPARPAVAGPPAAMPPETQISRTAYHGWPDAVRLQNGLVEAMVVPAIGRVLQFRFIGDDAGPFWENRPSHGGVPTRDANGWANYGGDKVWPAPQSAWTKITGRGWPPPAGFDGQSAQAEIRGGAVMLVFPADSAYGLQVRRRITLAPGRPVMTITTTFEKGSGPPVEVAVWTITQARDPEAVQIPLAGSAPNAPFRVLGGYAPPDVKSAPGGITLTRDPTANHKIGLRAASIRWVGRTTELVLAASLMPGAAYPDQDSAAEVYTNADPLPYVELELLGPLATMQAGDRIEQTVTYTLARRDAATAGGLMSP